MLMRIWDAVNSYMFDERHFALLAQLAEIHLDPAISDPRRLDELPDDERLDENGLPEEGPRLRWNTADAQRPSEAVRSSDTPHERLRRHHLGVNGLDGTYTPNGTHRLSQNQAHSGPWKGIFKDVGIFSQAEWDLIMCKCLASMGAD